MLKMEFLPFEVFAARLQYIRWFAEKIGVGKMRIYYAGTNLLTFTKYSGFDPEIGAGMGIDRGIYPQARVNTIGLNITFK